MAPEQSYHVLAGEVYGHPKKADGSLVKTSAIEKIDGRIITTESGSVYRLGRISRKYRRWLRKEGIEYDRKNPIKDKRCGNAQAKS
jgi:hypothetical protein